MGKLKYDATGQVEFDDRTLAHLQAVIAAKLRRGESFWFTWARPVEVGSGRVAIWVHPAIPIEISFAGSKAPQLNRAWIDVLMNAANSPAGLFVLDEPKGQGKDDS